MCVFCNGLTCVNLFTTSIECKFMSMLTRAAKYLIEECVCVYMCNTCTLSLTQIFGLKLLVLILFQWLSLGSSPLIVAAAKLACCYHGN